MGRSTVAVFPGDTAFFVRIYRKKDVDSLPNREKNGLIQYNPPYFRVLTCPVRFIFPKIAYKFHWNELAQIRSG